MDHRLAESIVRARMVPVGPSSSQKPPPVPLAAATTACSGTSRLLAATGSVRWRVAICSRQRSARLSSARCSRLRERSPPKAPTHLRKAGHDDARGTWRPGRRAANFSHLSVPHSPPGRCSLVDPLRSCVQETGQETGTDPRRQHVGHQ